MKIIISLFFLFISILAYTDDSTNDYILKLDIDTVVSMAMEHSFTLKNSTIDYNTGKLSLSTLWNKFIPSTSLQASIGQSESSRLGIMDSSNSLSFGVRTGLTLNANLAFTINQLAINYKSGVICLQQAKYQLKNNIKKYYYNLIILKQQMDLGNRLVENSKFRYNASIIKYNNGSYSEIDKLKSEYDYKSLVYEQSLLENSYSKGLLEFKQLLGIDDKTEIKLTSIIPAINSNEYLNYSKITPDNNLDIQLLTQQLKTIQNSRNGYIASLTPSLGLSYSFSSSFNKDPFNDQWFNDVKNDWDYSNLFGLSISFPLDSYFPFSSLQMQLINGQSEIQKIKNNLNDQKEKMMINIKTIIMNLKEIESNINSLKLNEQIADKTYLMMDKLYNAGSKNFLDLKDAENNLVDAKIKLLTAEYNYQTNILDLKYILNINDNMM